VPQLTPGTSLAGLPRLGNEVRAVSYSTTQPTRLSGTQLLSEASCREAPNEAVSQCLAPTIQLGVQIHRQVSNPRRQESDAEQT
jgi:hypothetical protein